MRKIWKYANMHANVKKDERTEKHNIICHLNHKTKKKLKQKQIHNKI